MKFPSFIRLPRNKRFGIDPRYYDPIKEEIEERTSAIKREMEGEANESTPGRISFARKTSAVPQTSFIQMGIAALLGGGVVGWLYFGNQILNILWVFVPIYLYFRFKKTKRSN